MQFAILDIDGCFTNYIKFPNLPHEDISLRGLNLKKNEKIAKYDYAYREMMQDEDEDIN